MKKTKETVSEVSPKTVIAPNPEPGFRLIGVNEPITGAFLYLGSCWDDRECKSSLIYTEDWAKHGVFYRKPIEDPDKAFESWYGGMMWTTSEPIVHAVAAWKAAKELYSKVSPFP